MILERHTPGQDLIGVCLLFFCQGWSVAKMVANELAVKQKTDSARWKIKPNTSSFWAEPDRVTAARRVLCNQTQHQQFLGRARQSYCCATRSLSNRECAAPDFIYVVFGACAERISNLSRGLRKAAAVAQQPHLGEN